MLAPPVWFGDRQATPVVSLLRWFVLQLNHKGEVGRSRSLMRKLSEKNIPALFDYRSPDEIDFLWEAIVELAAPPYQIWSDSRMRDLAACKPEQQRSLIFSYSAEALLRTWLNMPRIDPEQQAWLDALADWEYASLFNMDLLRESGYPGVYSPAKILQAIAKLHSFLERGTRQYLSWRQLSAGFFYGDSKYLESTGRQQWLVNMFPSLSALLGPRALLLNVHLVSEPQGILIIENQDTFCWLRQPGNNFPEYCDLHLVYGQGFTGSAARVRDSAVMRFNIDGDYTKRFAFEQDWFKSEAATNLPYYFWGDLDFSGIAILKSLRQQFVGIAAWQPGYQPMLDALNRGFGHAPGEAGKSNQLDPGFCGCEYADRILLPALHRSGLFLDQEWFSADLASQ